jgi:hypothetical protein
MLFWHLGATLWLFRWIYRDPKVDVRFLLVGAILPDLVDLALGTAVLGGSYSIGELWSHSLLIPSVYMASVLVLTRRGRRRRAFMALGIGWLLHLLIDGMWTDPDVLFWPFFGWELPGGQAPFWPLAWERAMSDPWRWVLEGAGLTYLIWLWLALGLGQAERRRGLASTGRLPEPVGEDA